jgi:hypothetical protein
MNNLDRASELVAAARERFEPTALDRERVRRRLGAAFAGAAASTAVTATATATTAKGVSALGGHTLLGLGKLLVGTVLVTVGTGTTLVVAARAVSSRAPASHLTTPTPSVPAPTRPPPSSANARISEPPNGEQGAEAAPLLQAPVETTNELKPRASPARSIAPRQAPATAAALAPPTASLDAELSLLQEAKHALTSADYVAARSGLARLDREHPAGALIEEREALRAVLACSTVAADRARALAAFRKRYPHSMYAPRVDSACSPETAAGARSTKSVMDPAAAGH